MDTLNQLVDAPDHFIAIAALAAIGAQRQVASTEPFEMLGLWAHWTAPKRVVHLLSGEESHELAVARIDDGKWLVSAYREGSSSLPETSIDIVSNTGELLRLQIDGIITTMRTIRHGDSLTLIGEGMVHEFGLPDLAAAEPEPGEISDRLIAPMPGVIKQINVKAGVAVLCEAPLLVMEAMKMELTLAAARDGIVAEVLVSEGQQVSDGDTVLTMEPLPE